MGPLAEEYAAKIAPKAKQGHGRFKMPIKPPTHMEYYEEDALAYALLEMIQISRDVELRKNELSLRHDFNLHDTYVIFDTENKGHITLREFEQVYDMYRIYPRTENLRLTFRNLDRDLDGRVSLKEFLDGFAPLDKNYREVVLRRRSYNEGTNFSRLQPFTPDT